MAWSSSWVAVSSQQSSEVQKVRLGLAGLVVLVWLIGYVLAYVHETQNPTELSGLMAVVLGWAFAGTVKDSIKGKNGGDDERG